MLRGNPRCYTPLESYPYVTWMCVLHTAYSSSAVGSWQSGSEHRPEFSAAKMLRARCAMPGELFRPGVLVLALYEQLKAWLLSVEQISLGITD